jgi:UDP-N-acetylmuramate--alanine ligase
MEKIPSLIGKIVKPGDMIIIMGAGSIYRIIPDIIKTLEAKG